MCVVGIVINLVLMALNLFPLLPLDGGRILNALLPPRWRPFSRLEPYGILILLALLFLPNGNPPGCSGRRCSPWSAACWN
jgi:Zn-dependent protease